MDHLSEFPFLLSQVLFIHFINGNHVMQDSCFTAFALLLKTLDIIGYCSSKENYRMSLDSSGPLL